MLRDIFRFDIYSLYFVKWAFVVDLPEKYPSQLPFLHPRLLPTSAESSNTIPKVIFSQCQNTVDNFDKTKTEKKG